MCTYWMMSAGATVLGSPVSDMHCAAVPGECKGLTGGLDTYLSQISFFVATTHDDNTIHDHITQVTSEKPRE